MTATWVMLLVSLHLSTIAGIRVYTGTALNTPEPFETESKISKRSWSNEASQPGLYKVKLTQRGYIQFLRYLVDVPSLQQYTFCLWMMSTNYTYNHPIFSYSRQEQESLVKVWLNPKDSTLRATFKDEPVLRVPVNLREGRWYHICQSWSGITGEWVVFIDGKVKSHDRVNQHIGTTLPGGGDIAVGQELTDFNKGLDDGVEGEIFGFNLVDEAIHVHEPSLTFSHYRPEIEPKSSNIPQFKKLPNMRKSFDEIKEFISQLPKDLESATAAPALATIRPGELPASSQPRRVKPRVRSKPPLRKVVVYREERMDRSRTERKRINQLDNTNIIPEAPRPKISQVYDANYNMHSFKGIKNQQKAVGYKTYEDEEEEERLEEAATSAAGATSPSSLTRRARQNFNVHSLWEANRLHPFYVKLLEPPSSKSYHFEKSQLQASRRSLNLEPLEDSTDLKNSNPRTRSTLPDAIPVYEEIDESHRRRKRDLVERDPQTGAEFRRLPSLPNDFVKLLTPNQDKETILARLSFYIGNSTATTAQLPPAVTLTGSQAFQRKDPQYFPNSDDILLSESQVPQESQNQLETRPQQIEKRIDAGNAGNELVRRSYSHCGVMRGSPFTDKRHVLISWADTPVRIYGGAIVTNANNVCGYF